MKSSSLTVVLILEVFRSLRRVRFEEELDESRPRSFVE